MLKSSLFAQTKVTKIYENSNNASTSLENNSGEVYCIQSKNSIHYILTGRKSKIKSWHFAKKSHIKKYIMQNKKMKKVNILYTQNVSFFRFSKINILI